MADEESWTTWADSSHPEEEHDFEFKGGRWVSVYDGKSTSVVNPDGVLHMTLDGCWSTPDVVDLLSYGEICRTQGESFGRKEAQREIREALGLRSEDRQAPQGEQLLDLLAEDFYQRGYSMKWVGDDRKFIRGFYIGAPVDDVAKFEPSYIQWILYEGGCTTADAKILQSCLPGPNQVPQRDKLLAFFADLENRVQPGAREHDEDNPPWPSSCGESWAHYQRGRADYNMRKVLLELAHCLGITEEEVVQAGEATRRAHVESWKET